jgi:N-acetylglucosaminyldiphosphoundecaprenol N-acetyl-beta-D-mannosaminyltransferase
MKTKQLFGTNITLAPYQTFVDELIEKALEKKSAYACVAAVHMLVEAYKADSFAAILNEADMVTPDGKPITWALNLLYGIRQDRAAGMDLLPDLLSRAEQQKIPVAFYGGTQAMLDRTREYMQKHYPALIVASTYSPPFRPLTAAEEDTVADMLNASGARMIFVVLGCPKQEKWMAAMKDRIQALMIGIGAAVPVLVGMQKRAPRWMQHAGLEWVYRLAQEPRRLFRRYATTNSFFIYLVLKEKFALRKLFARSKEHTEKQERIERQGIVNKQERMSREKIV